FRSKKDVPVLRVSTSRSYLQFPAAAGAHCFVAQYSRIRPIKKFQSEVFVGHDRAADLRAQFVSRKFFRAGVGDKIEAGSVFAEAQFQDFVRIDERITDERPGLSEMKGDRLFVLAQLPIEIDLLSRLEHADRIQDFFG